MKKVLLALGVSLLILPVSGQTIDNINLLNTRGLHGTARYTAMGGAFTALGSDLSAIHINPAAASVFRRGEVGVSFGFQNQYDETSFLNTRNRNSNFRFLFENAGFVKSFGDQKTPFVLSISANKIADFNSVFTANGINQFNPNPGSGYTLGEYWLAGVQDLTIRQMENAGFWEEASAADATVLLVDSIGAFIYDYYPDDASNVEYVFDERGYSDELQISIGSRLSDRFFYGLSLGFPYMNYSNRTSLRESGFADSSFIKSYQLNRSNDVYANGFNIKLGIILKPIQMLRIGVSYQSPSWYNVEELYYLNVDGFASNQTFPGTEYVFNNIRYGLATPSIYRAGAALVLFRSLIVSLDYEFTDPSNINLSSRDGNNYLAAESEYIQITQGSQTIKAGTEWRIGPMFLRGGIRYTESNFREPELYVSDVWNYNLGAGFGNRDFSIDVAYTWSNFSRNFFVHPFLGDNLDGNGVVDNRRASAVNDITRGNLIVGASFRF